MIDPAESDDFIRKKGGYQLRPDRDPYYSWSNVYRKHFWQGYARGEEKKGQSGKAAKSNAAVSADIKILPGKETYAPEENITIRFSGLPGNQQDWITLVGKGAPANKYGQWFYTKGRRSGSHRFKGLKPGEYELRVYLDWPRGGYNIVARQPVIIGPSQPAAVTVAHNLDGQWELLDQQGKPYV